MNEEPSRKKLKWWGRICLKFTLFPWQCDSIHELHTELNFVVVWALFWGGKTSARKRENLFQFFQHFFFSCARRCSVVASGWRRELKYFFQTHTADLKKHALVSTTPHFISLAHTLQHFFTFNVIVLVVVVGVVCELREWEMRITRRDE